MPRFFGWVFVNHLTGCAVSRGSRTRSRRIEVAGTIYTDSPKEGYYKVGKWQDYVSLLRCLDCGSDLRLDDAPKRFGEYPLVNAELACSCCDRIYPLCDDIPVMFRDAERTRALIDPSSHPEMVEKAEQAVREAIRLNLTGDQLAAVRREENQQLDALSWELLFWEQWKGPEKKWHILDKETIEEYLARDTDSGGRLRFLGRVLSLEGNSGGKRLLNIGAGKDLILERLLSNGFNVVEQDIILDSLLLLKQRQAGFCVCCDARALPFKDDSFDVSTSLGVLHHIWPLEEPLSELLRVTTGNVHINEPNSFASTRAALILPGFVKRRMRAIFSGDHTHSPYEQTISPMAFKRLARGLGAQVVDYQFPRSGWIRPGATGMKRVFRIIEQAAVRSIPMLSSHFEIVLRKTT